jgi:hypothetical protein
MTTPAGFDQQYGYRASSGDLQEHDNLPQTLNAQDDLSHQPGPDYDAVKVQVENAGSTDAVQTGVYQTVVIPASTATVCSVAQVLGRDIKRQYGRVMAIDGPVVIATNQQMAQNTANIATAAAPVTPAVPATTVAAQNTSANPVQVVISGGTVTVVAVNGVTVGSGDGTYAVPGYGSIAVTYSGVPTWAWTYATAVLTLPNPQGVYLPAQSLSDSIHHNEVVWAANPSTTASCRVSVYVERGF